MWIALDAVKTSVYSSGEEPVCSPLTTMSKEPVFSLPGVTAFPFCVVSTVITRILTIVTVHIY